ncbi:ECF transporter S component [Bifidobacterium ruminantium]|jgi:energy-coupling factor transport system substrate-specific component|uniref:ABC transporter, permease protein n=1 Tax=Bifidobacterium ruminantium TaxID=78346 RepID=A0A087D494_BIFRU|nr:ECF transporter S component [Bifidobacterium ruminantium]KFI90344.1 ABC transporter, permease protein [Bifidobacterium ruminantium]
MTEQERSSVIRKHSNKWRVVDIVVTAIIAVASGVIFWGWDIVCTAPLAIFEAVTPGFEGLLNVFWLFAGPLAAIIVRKPGAALFAETLAAALELTMGNQWGVGGSLIVGIMQGLGAEIGFAIFAYKKWNPLSTAISGALAGIGCGLYYWLTNPAWSVLRASIYLGTSIISGAILAGLVMYLLQVAIAKTGVLDRFESGRTQELV